MRRKGRGSMRKRKKVIMERRKRRVLSGIIAVVLVAAMGLGMFLNFETKVQAAPNTVVDPDTTNDWTNYTRPGGHPSTQNVGRIWTDKSVFNDTYTFKSDDNAGLSGKTIGKGDSDFLVSLSALSSTSNLKSTTTSTTPLDIVLVLDVSGSMDESMGVTYTYTEAYPYSNWGTYYIQVNGAWQQVEYFEPDRWDSDPEGWRYRSGGSFFYPEYTYVEPKTSASDGDSSHVQFYTRQQSNTDKINALKTAANRFISSVGDMNADIADENNQHRIAIVKYADDSYRYEIGNDRGAGGNDSYNYTQVVSDFSTNSSELQNDINALRAGGATSADFGLTMAQNVINGGTYNGDGGDSGTYVGARGDAQKVVIFFTDGEPNHSSNWDGDVAATSVNIAHDMKEAGTTIYTIGVVNGAAPDQNPANASNLNKYLHAVSSNYKDATAENRWGNASWYDLSLGERTQKDGEDANYYYAASDAEELDQVFDDITSSITENAGSGSPIIDNSPEGNTDPGDLTFTDQLGNYMQVTGIDGGSQDNPDVMKLAYGDQIYTSTSKSTDGNIDTYHFSGQVGGNEVYGPANLSDLVVTVEHGNDLAEGDKVTVTLPASLLPMRHYDVDTETNTMTVSQAYPVRLFYGVSLKEAAEEALADPTSDEYAAIIGSQASADKTKLDFYSNSFVKDAADGSTTAEFTPNEGNKFYYYTSNTQLFLDEACSQPATRANSEGRDTLYYKDVYWTLTGNVDEAREVTDGYGTVTRNGSEWENINWGNGNSDQAYVPAHTERADRPAAMTSQKEDNTTGTAGNVLNPAWVGGSVEQRLGNNGKLSLDMPGSFEIKKTVDWGNASDQTKQDKNNFTFEVSLTDADGATLNGSYPYYVNGSDESAGEVSNGGTINIAGNQSVEVKGLPAGSKFTVTEQGANQNGFTTTDTTAQQGQENNENDGTVNGTIEAGSQISVSFTNTYHASDVNLNTKTTLKVQKNLEGRDWRDTDSFEFTIAGSRSPAGVSDMPMPENRAITVDAGDKDNGYTASFGDITFSTPGEYRYTIQENGDPEQPIAGINYSDAIYRVTVMVGDNGTGALTIDSVKIERMYNDDGTLANTENEGEVVQDDTMAFKNTYSADNDTEGIQGKKDYDDTTGGNPFEDGEFKFKLEAQGGFETDGGSADDLTISANDTPMPDNAQSNTITTSNAGEEFTFPSITFDGNDVGNTYVYKVTEVAGNEAGMTYSNEEHTVMIKVEEVTDADGTHIVATVLGDYADPDNLVFKNTYDPDDAQLTKDAGTAIHGTKTLTGRDMKDGETFYFQLTQTNGPATILDKTEVVAVNKDNMQSGSADFNFADMTFSKTGTYTFKVNEIADANGTETTNGSGMTYDTNIATVTVTVTDGNKSDNPDDHGKLLASVTYSNDKHGDTTDKALFANTYEASMNYGAEGEGGIAVTKQLNGRPMANDEFAFSIAGTDSGTVTADEANAKLTDADKSFKNTGAAANTSITMAKLQNVSFDQSDAGKTYSYIVDETTTDDADALPGVTCDQTQYRVDIQVVDNGDGNMHTLTTVTKIKDASGADADKVVIDKANSGADDYKVPTFGFVNEYNPTPAEAGEGTDHKIQVTKTVTGAPSPDGVSYSFTLTATGDNIGNITGLDDKNQLHVSTNGTINAGESQTMDFGKLTFSQKGTYTFTVQEDTPDADDGWTYDTDPQTVTIVVTDVNDKGQYDGKLYIQSVTGSPVEITNSYKPGSVIVGGEGVDQQITVQKSVTGADSMAEFQFKIEIVDEDDPKWDNVEVADDSFSDTISITDGVTQAQSKTANFAGIQFNATGEYQFKITEVGAADFNAGDNRNGWTYDEHEAIVTVNVTDDNFDGQLDATVSYENGAQAAEFTNKYEAGSTTLKGEESFKGTKKIEGRKGIEDETFGFTLKKGDVSNDGDWDKVTFKSGDDEAAAFDTVNATATMSKDSNSAEFSFDGTFTFSKAGTYIFNVTETSHNDKDLPTDGTNGMTYDRHTGTITVTVADDGKGNLKATATAGEGNASTTFVNRYAAAPATATGDTALKLTKKVTGAPALRDFDFNVKIKEGDASNVKLGSGDGLTEFPTEGITVSTKNLFDEVAQQGKQDSETVGFGDITFTAVGDYTFTVTETTTTDQDGWTYASGEDNAQTIRVYVTDEGYDGQLDVTVDGNNPTFTNKYESGSITTGTDNGINVQKTLTGRYWQEGDSFEFVLEAVDNAPMPEDDGNKVTITNESNPKTAVFDGITYDAAGEYKYTVKETKGDLGGVTYDEHVVNVTVTIADEDYDGSFEVKSVVYDNSDATTEADKAENSAAAFTNTYDAGSTDVDTGTAEAQLTKVLEGKAWNGDKFTFKIEAVSNTAGIEVAAQPMPAQTEVTIDKATDKDADDNDQATFSFGKISYDTPGTYVYKVTEVEGNNGGIDYSTNEATITVTVTDNNDGTYTTGVTVANNVFTNTYATELNYHTSGGLEIVKTFIGHDMDEFEFTVTPVAAADGSTTAQEAAAKLNINETGKTVSTKAAGASDTEVDGVPASVAEVAVLDSNDEAKFTQADEGKTYTYEVKEMTGSQSGVTYDDTVYTVTITTEDDGIGGITVTTTVTSDDGTSQAYTYDNNNQTVDQTARVPFSNSYQASGELGGSGDVSINATKTLTNRPMTDGEFTFNVYNTADQDKKTVSTGTNDTDGLITFGAIKYDVQQMLKDVEAGLATAGTDDEGRDTYTYNYMVEEDAGNFVNGVSGVTTSFPVAVTVTDNNDGTLGIAVDYGNSDSLTFENAYGTSANAELNVNGTKVLETGMGANNAPDITDKYTFTISGTADDGTEAPLPEKTEATNDSAGNVDFGKITYTMQNVFGDDGTDTTAVEDEAAADESGQTQSGETEDEATDATVETTDVAGETNNEGIDLQSAERTKTFTYTVTETGTVAGVDNDPEATKTFTVTVTDNGKGTISVASDPEGAKFRFTNTYNVDPVESSPTGEGGITITKNLDGRNLNNDEFTFELADQSGTVVATGTNDANGNVELGTVKFTEPGTVTYTIREVDNNLGGVDYDTAQYKATATVTDNRDGTLKVEWSFADAQGSPIEGTEITFNNTYKAEATSVSLGAGKLIKGRDLKAGEFSFLLTDADGKEIDTAKNEENGAVTFKTITFDKAGTYRYEIREVLPEDDDSKTDGIQSSNVTYDENIYHVTVDVKDNTEKGCLEATVTYEDSDGAPVFVNTYTEPADDGDDVGIFGVKTGDPAETAILLTIMGVALAVIVAMSAILIRRRRR